MTLWSVMLACGIVTFAIRYSFIAAEGHFQPAEWFRRLLPFVPIAALTALTTPELILIAGQFDWLNPRLWGGFVAIAVAARWGRPVPTIASGFAVFWMAQGLR